MNIYEAIKKRKSVRSFQDKEVEQGKLDRIMEAVRLAPSASNRQEWRFIIVKEKEMRQKQNKQYVVRFKNDSDGDINFNDLIKGEISIHSNTIDDFGMTKAFENVKKEWGELFKPKNVKVADGQPITNLNEKPKKSVREMTSAERLALALELSKK